MFFGNFRGLTACMSGLYRPSNTSRHSLHLWGYDERYWAARVRYLAQQQANMLFSAGSRPQAHERLRCDRTMSSIGKICQVTSAYHGMTIAPPSCLHSCDLTSWAALTAVTLSFSDC
jgi:hypothetical protein